MSGSRVGSVGPSTTSPGPAHKQSSLTKPETYQAVLAGLAELARWSRCQKPGLGQGEEGLGGVLEGPVREWEAGAWPPPAHSTASAHVSQSQQALTEGVPTMSQTPGVQREGPWAHAVIPNPNATASFYYVFPQGPHF